MITGNKITFRYDEKNDKIIFDIDNVKGEFCKDEYEWI
jgi:hypothetical protein